MSLRRLGLDRIDLFQLHRIDAAYPVADQVGELKQLQDEGKIRHIGLSEVSVAELQEAQETAEIVSVQNLYNLAKRDAEELLDHIARPITIGQKTAPPPRVAWTTRITPSASAASAIAGPASVSRRTRPGRRPPRDALSAPGVSLSNRESTGTTSHSPMYMAMPSPPSAVASRNAARTHSTGSPRWRARPPATPPRTGASESRVTRRTSPRGWVGAVVMTCQGSQSGGSRPMGKHPEPTLRRIRPGSQGFRVVPDGGERLEDAGLMP